MFFFPVFWFQMVGFIIHAIMLINAHLSAEAHLYPSFYLLAFRWMSLSNVSL